MSYTYLREQGVESSAECFSDIPVSVLSSLKLTAARSYCSGNGTASCPNSQSGTISELLTDGHGGPLSMLCAEDSPVKESVWPVAEPDLTTKKADCGGNKPGSLAKFDPVTCSWKTHQCSLFEAGFESLQTLPRWGMTVAGELYPLPMSSGLLAHRAWIMNALESGFTGRLPTVRASPNENRQTKLTPSQLERKHGLSLCAVVNRMPTPTAQDAKNNCGPSQVDRDALNVTVGGPLNPEWVEWLMGWPIGWTGLQPLAMARFQQWWNAHGKL